MDSPQIMEKLEEQKETTIENISNASNYIVYIKLYLGRSPPLLISMTPLFYYPSQIP